MFPCSPSFCLGCKMGFFTFKKIEVPASNETRTVEAIQLWEVRWTSRRGEFHADTEPAMEAFPTEQEANEFAAALRNAFKLLKHTGAGTRVSVSKAK
jgi:hypothetical protein